jgi:hypothetical protein
MERDSNAQEQRAELPNQPLFQNQVATSHAAVTSTSSYARKNSFFAYLLIVVFLARCCAVSSSSLDYYLADKRLIFGPQIVLHALTAA